MPDAQGGAGGTNVPPAADISNLHPLVGRGLFIIALLFVINIFNFIDRQLPFILIQSIKQDLDLSDSQIGLMAGLTFALVYSFAGLPLARLADRWSPRLVLTISLSVWSAMTALSGLAQNFLHLVLGRIGVAGAEAATTPTAHALISRIYQPERRALALALFSVGVSIGSLLGLALGGWINDLANWRVAFFIVGVPGLVIAFVAWKALPEIPRLGQSGVAGPRFFATMRYLFGLRSFRHMALACSLYACGSYAMNVFASAFLIRAHDLTTAQAGLGFGIAFGLGGGLGTFVGGVLADSLGKRDARWRQLIPAIGQILSIPVALGAWLIGDATSAVILLTFTYFFGLLYFAPSFATAQSLVPNEIRAMAAAVLLFCLTLVGSSVGPMVVGWMSDHLVPQYGALSLRYALCLMGITMLWSGVHFYFAARALPADLQQVK